MGAQLLDVLHQIPRGVVLDTRVRGGPPCPTLIEQHHPIRRRIEELPMKRRAAGARSAVKKDGGEALGIPAHLVGKPVSARHRQHAGVVRSDGRIKRNARVHAPCEPL